MKELIQPSQIFGKLRQFHQTELVKEDDTRLLAWKTLHKYASSQSVGWLSIIVKELILVVTQRCSKEVYLLLFAMVPA